MNPDNLREGMLRTGKEKARTAAYFATQDRLRKQIKAKWTVYYIDKGNTVGKSEQLALLEDDYVKACERCEKAESEAGVAAVEYEAAKAWFDAWRTLEATKRAEINLR